MTAAPSQPDRRPDTPKRVRNGLKLRGEGAYSAGSWIAQRWLCSFESVMSPVQLAEGLEYARRGQTITLDLGVGLIEAQIQGRAPGPYRTVIRIPQLDQSQWQRAIDAMAREAIYAAKILAGDVPPAAEALFRASAAELFPADGTVEVECTCKTGGPCKHAAAISYLAAQQLDGTPLLTFTLRGMRASQVVKRLVQTRAVQSHGQAAAHGDAAFAAAVDDAMPLEECLEEFWRYGPELAEIEQLPPPDHAPHALLRRMGPSPLPGRFPLVGLLASVYDTVRDAAIRLRDEAEGINGAEDEP